MRKTTIVMAALGLTIVAGAQALGQPPVAPGGPWREIDPQNILVIDTNKGRIIAELSPAVAPRHVERIKALARQGLYDNRVFFRVIEDFMAQTGDPQDTGQGGSAMPDLQPEFTFRRDRDAGFIPYPSKRGLTGFIGAVPVLSQPEAQMAITADGKVAANGLFCKGVLGMARASDPASANSQFFLMREKVDSLNNRYTAFGRVLSGLDVVRQIKTGEPVAPPQDMMLKVRVLADLPAADRPTIRVQPANAPQFVAQVEALKKTKGAAFDICDLDIPVSVQ